MHVLVSLHDVTPAHLPRLERAERVLRRAGVTTAAYLLVPDYHGGHPIAGNDEFQGWCLQSRSFEVEWVLHGYRHLDDAPADSRGLLTAARRRWLTAGEGEFLCLDEREQAARVSLGVAALHFLPRRPRAFVAPAWLYNDALPGVLRAADFGVTEDHRRVYDLVRGLAHACPAITWATRSRMRRIGSRVAAPLALRAFVHLPVVRIALHPFDMDHPATVASIERTLGDALDRRMPASYDVFVGDA